MGGRGAGAPGLLGGGAVDWSPNAVARGRAVAVSHLPHQPPSPTCHALAHFTPISQMACPRSDPKPTTAPGLQAPTERLCIGGGVGVVVSRNEDQADSAHNLGRAVETVPSPPTHPRFHRQKGREGQSWSPVAAPASPSIRQSAGGDGGSPSPARPGRLLCLSRPRPAPPRAVLAASRPLRRPHPPRRCAVVAARRVRPHCATLDRCPSLSGHREDSVWVEGKWSATL